jgi:hypothetical protein
MGRGKKLDKEQLALRAKVAEFLRRLQSELGLAGLTKRVFSPLLNEMNRGLSASNETFKDTHLRALQQTNPNCGQEVFEAFVMAIPAVHPWRQNASVAGLYKEIFGLEMQDLSPDRAVFNFQRADRNPLGATSEIYGDYLLYRAEALDVGQRTPRVSRSFLRFYIHKNGYLRSMGLWLDEENRFLSSKGWVVQQKDNYLVIGHVVDRAPASLNKMRKGMGAVMMSVRFRENRYVVRRPENGVQRLQIAPVLHFRSTDSAEASFSKGVLIRLRGVEHLGGDGDVDKQERYKRIKDLQMTLESRLARTITIGQAAKELARASGFESSLFFNKADSYGIPSGLLVNRPTHRPPHKDGDDFLVGATEHELDDRNRILTLRDVDEDIPVAINFEEFKISAE